MNSIDTIKRCRIGKCIDDRLPESDFCWECRRAGIRERIANRRRIINPAIFDAVGTTTESEVVA